MDDNDLSKELKMVIWFSLTQYYAFRPIDQNRTFKDIDNGIFNFEGNIHSNSLYKKFLLNGSMDHNWTGHNRVIES